MRPDQNSQLKQEKIPFTKPRLTASPDSAALEALVGEYESPNVVLKFALEGAGSASCLFVYTPGQARTEMFVDSAGIYYPKDFDALARFEKNYQGVMESVLWMPGGGAGRGKKRAVNNFKLEANTFIDYVGEYVFNPSFSIRIFERNERYFAQATNQPEFEIIADEKDKFSVRVITATFFSHARPQVRSKRSSCCRVAKKLAASATLMPTPIPTLIQTL